LLIRLSVIIIIRSSPGRSGSFAFSGINHHSTNVKDKKSLPFREGFFCFSGIGEDFLLEKKWITLNKMEVLREKREIKKQNR
jgi:hypothetical protein